MCPTDVGAARRILGYFDYWYRHNYWLLRARRLASKSSPTDIRPGIGLFSPAPGNRNLGAASACNGGGTGTATAGWVGTACKLPVGVGASVAVGATGMPAVRAGGDGEATGGGAGG